MPVRWRRSARIVDKAVAGRTCAWEISVRWPRMAGARRGRARQGRGHGAEAAHRHHRRRQPAPTATARRSRTTQGLRDADLGFSVGSNPCVVTAADGRVVWDNDVYGVPGR